MPLVFVTDAPTVWASNYADIVGVQYEFPDRYRGQVQSGERFLYYRGSRGANQGGVGYFGEGIVGNIRPSGKPSHLIASVYDVVLFADVVPIKDGMGDYFETGSTSGTNWANGVRRIADSAYDSIMRKVTGSGKASRPGPGFASPAHASIMERYSVQEVMRLLRSEFGKPAVVEMPVNNPGYDILVSLTTGDVHVEVKGTVLPAPIFHLSEGQRRHAALQGERFRLYVVYGIDTSTGSHKVEHCDGLRLNDRAALQPASWTGVLRTAAN